MQMAKWCTKQNAKIIVVKVKTVFMGSFLPCLCTVNIYIKKEMQVSGQGIHFLKKQKPKPTKKTPCLFASEKYILTSNNKQ